LARIRSLKIGFFQNEALCELSMSHRLLYAGLWVIADRNGRLEDRPKRIKVQLFPYDSVDVDQGLDDLAAAGFIVRYTASGRECISIPKFAEHQRPHPKEPSANLPAPPEVIEFTPKNAKPRKATAEPGKNTALPGKDPAEPGKNTYEPVRNGLGDLGLGNGLGDLGQKEILRVGPKAPTRDLLALFDECHLAKLGTKADLTPKKDGAILAAIWKQRQGDPVTVEALIRAFFDDNDPWVIERGYTVGVFKTQVGKLVTRLSGHDAPRRSTVPDAEASRKFLEEAYRQ
jgi:hypothetical protein